MENGFYKLLKFTDIGGLCQFLRDMNIVEEEIQKPVSEFTLEEIKSELVQYDGDDLLHDDDFSEEQVAKELEAIEFEEYQEGIDPDPDNWKEQLKYEGLEETSDMIVEQCKSCGKMYSVIEEQTDKGLCSECDTEVFKESFNEEQDYYRRNDL